MMMSKYIPEIRTRDVYQTVIAIKTVEHGLTS